MPILTKEVEVRLNGNNVNYYRNLGYNIPMREAGKAMKYRGVDYVADFSKTILVKIKDLPLNSKMLVESTCDYCGKPKPLMKYLDYNKQTKNGMLKCCCEECASIKHKEIMFEKYGYESTMQVPEIREKVYKTNNQKYGCNSPYGNSLVMAKAKQTNIERYGYENAMQSPDFFQKWLEKNSSNFVKSSKQQRYLCNFYNGILNYPVQHFSLDICILEDKLDIEFDGSGHKMCVKLKKMTQDEFDKREIVRYQIIKKEGYKQMRIISFKDLLPSDETLLQMLTEAKQYFSEYPNHSWIEFDIDNSIIRNAEHKDGVRYNYGKLRKIKDSDLSESIA